MHVKWIHSILQWSWIQENTTTSCTLRNNCSILRFFIPHQQNGYLHKNNTHPQLTQPQQGNTNTAPKDTTKYKITFTKIIFHAERFLGNLIPLCRSLYYCVHSLYMIFKILSIYIYNTVNIWKLAVKSQVTVRCEFGTEGNKTNAYIYVPFPLGDAVECASPCWMCFRWHTLQRWSNTNTPSLSHPQLFLSGAVSTVACSQTTDL